MPEGDTVFHIAHRLRAALEGKTLTRSDFRVPKEATVDLSGTVVTGVRSVGKHLFIDVVRADPAGSDHRPLSIHSHLKMEGAWHVHATGARWRRPAHTARVVLRSREVEAVGFDLGVLEVLTDPSAAVAHLGPDLLGPEWDPDVAVANLAAVRRDIGHELVERLFGHWWLIIIDGTLMDRGRDSADGSARHRYVVEAVLVGPCGLRIPIMSEFADVRDPVRDKEDCELNAFQRIAAIETPDDATVVIRLTEPYAPLMSLLSVFDAPVLPRHVYEGTDPLDNPANFEPVGSGPFRFSEWVRGERIEIVRNDDYYLEPALLDRIVFRVVPQDVARSTAIEVGEADLADKVLAAMRLEFGGHEQVDHG